MRYFLRLPGVRFVGLCDIYEPRIQEARGITGEATPAFSDYRNLLDEVEMDGIVIATPLYLHGEHYVAALDRGLHVYGEKSMGFTVSDCDAIVGAAGRNKGIFQVGHQYRYAPWYRDAIRRVADGEIGKVTHIFGYWHRNYNWRRPVPEPGLERLINWRLYREYSGGLLAELGSHHIDVANWIFDEMPATVVGNGGISFYHDGRETFDNVQAVFKYPGGGTLVFSSLIGNHKMGYQIIVYGTGGTLELTLEDGTFYYEPIRENSAVPEEMMSGGPYTSPTLSTSGDMPYRGAGLPVDVPEGETGDPTYLCCKAFVDAVRDGGYPDADQNVGWASAVSVALGNKAIRDFTPIKFADYVSPEIEAFGG
jgi:predicted dehydrogenase